MKLLTNIALWLIHQVHIATTAYLCINDKDESTSTSKDVLRVKSRVEEVDLTRKVPDLIRKETL